MALSPIAFIAPVYRDFKTHWLKAYDQGTTTPKSMALDSAGVVTVAKLQLNADGFLESAGGALVIPYINGAYDAWLFPTEAEADANDTSSAEQVADNITGVNGLAISAVESLPTLNAAVISTSILEGMAINIKERTTGNGGGAIWDVVLASSVTPNTYDIVQCSGVPTLALVMRDVEGLLTVSTVASMKATDLIPRQTVDTQGYHEGWAAQKEQQGAASYVISLLADIRAAKSDGAWVPDEAVDHTLANGYVAMFQTDGGIHAKQAGAKGDDSTNDGAALVAAEAWLSLNGLGDIDISDGIYQISSLFTLSTGIGLIGQERSNAVIKQINTSVGGVKLSGFNRLKSVRIEAPSTNVNTTTKAIEGTGTQSNTIEDCRLLWFGYGFYSTGLTWLNNIRNVRVENPTNTGFHFQDANANLQLTLEQCYVVNNSILGLTNKTSIYIDGCQGIELTNFTSDGGEAVSRKNLGMNIINSGVVINVGHFEAYRPPTGFIAGAEYDGIIRISGSTVTMSGLRFHTCFSDVPVDDVLIYAENQSKVTLNSLVANTNTMSEFTSQQVGVSDDFGDNLIELSGCQRNIVLGAQRGSGFGEAQYTRKGIIKKETIVGASTIIDVNLISKIILLGTVGDVSGFSNPYSDEQKISMVARQAGVTLTHSAAFRLIGGVDRVVAVNDTYNFEYVREALIWVETSRNLT